MTRTESPGSYVIWRTFGAGFWSIVASTLSHMKIAEDRGLIPVVDFANHKTIYNESEPVRDTWNMWEYYFEQPAGRSLDQVEPGAYVCDGRIPASYRGELSEVFFREMWHAKSLIKPQLRESIEQKIREMNLSQSTLGVHIRGQEARRARGHQFPATLKQLNDAIAFAVDHYDFKEILLVSETQQYVDTIARQWHNKLNIQISPTFRLRNRNSYRLRRPPRPQHMYHLGFEALQDAHLLAACGGIIRGNSGLSDAASMIKAESFEPFIKISQGRNSFRPYISSWLWYAKRALPPEVGGFQPWTPPAEN